eukprot:NODE_13923_length_1138_cov_8.477745.p5 GENE.NODE_13923_length_1138_cov_8.477745~~NODE_13923_length_1138_cov_8.477745.p5  ORF type:complete len:91 (-),score=7.92 NODE_13923_length_1138_cov_8.477745:320-592(-)
MEQNCGSLHAREHGGGTGRGIRQHRDVWFSVRLSLGARQHHHVRLLASRLVANWPLDTAVSVVAPGRQTLPVCGDAVLRGFCPARAVRQP